MMSSLNSTVARQPGASPYNEVKYATAADLPPELYDLILNFLGTIRYGDDHRGDQNTRNKVFASKCELGVLALVCKSWAEMCQRKIFPLVVLRTGQDLHELLQLAAHPLSRISEYIETLELIPKRGTAPWIHQVCMKVQPSEEDGNKPGSPFPNYTGHTLRLVFNDGFEILRSGLQALLPRSNPAFLRNIQTLHIEYSMLNAIEDVLRIAKELPDLEAISLNNLTWAKEPKCLDMNTLGPLAAPRAGRKNSSLCAILVAGCSAQWAGLSIACMADTTRRVCDEDLVGMTKLAKTVMTSVEKAGHSYFTSVALYPGEYRLSVLATLDTHLAPIIAFGVSKGSVPGRTQLDTIALEFASTSHGHYVVPLEDMLAYDWEGFDEQASSLKTLRHVEMRFASQEDLSIFAEKVLPRMSLWDRAEKFKYAMLDGDGSEENPWNWAPSWVLV